MSPRPAGVPISRRRLLQVGGAALASYACGGASVPVASRPAAPRSGVPFNEPSVLRAHGGSLEATLRAAAGEHGLSGANGNRRVSALTYNGSLPGPTLRLFPGERLDLTLENRLPETPPACAGAWQGDQNRPHGFDTTNLHTHGLHVSPASIYSDGRTEPTTAGELPQLASDDVLLAVPPGADQKYRIWLPDFHAPGTHWYHAHKHGSAALQVASGLAGALIVEEPTEDHLVDDSADRLWLIHEAVGELAHDIYTRNPPLPTFLVNGVERPTLEVRPGRLERWRFINGAASLGGTCKLRLLDGDGNSHQFHLMAVDGISFYGRPPQPRTTWLLPPGGRADLLVQVDRPGRYRLIKDSVEGGPKTFRQVLAEVVVEGKRAADQLPDKIPGEFPEYLSPIETATFLPGKVRFGIQGETREQGPCGILPSRFVINDRLYDHDRIDHDLELGGVEEWELANDSEMIHAFHIHVNPFQVTEGPDRLMDPTAPDEPANRIWRDTLSVPPRTAEGPGRVRIRSRFANYAGRFVLHCHILVHEDLGMMQNVRVRGAGAPPCARLERPLAS